MRKYYYDILFPDVIFWSDDNWNVEYEFIGRNNNRGKRGVSWRNVHQAKRYTINDLYEQHKAYDLPLDLLKVILIGIIDI